MHIMWRKVYKKKVYNINVYTYLLCIGSGPLGTLLLLTMTSLESEWRACLCMLTNFNCLERTFTFIGTRIVLLVWWFIVEIVRNINHMIPRDNKAPKNNLLQLKLNLKLVSIFFISLMNFHTMEVTWSWRQRYKSVSTTL